MYIIIILIKFSRLVYFKAIMNNIFTFPKFLIEWYSIRSN